MHDVTVLANAGCAHCRHALEVLAEEAEHLGASFAAIDLSRHPEEAERWGLECSPIVVVDHARAFPGIPSEDTLRGLLAA